MSRGLKVQSATASTVASNNLPSHWYPPVDLSHLTVDQQEIVRAMLYEESSAFAWDANDIGCIPSLQMTINLKDDIPVQKAYSSIPKTLFSEVKVYIQDPVF